MKRTKAINDFIDYTLVLISEVFIMEAFWAPTPAETVFYGIFAAIAVVAVMLNSMCGEVENESQDK